jgi:hypothetical protein
MNVLRLIAMTQIIDAFFDGDVLHPKTPLGLAPNTHVRVTVESLPLGAQPPQSFLDVASSLKLDGPSDWSKNLEDYLYGNADRPRG